MKEYKRSIKKKHRFGFTLKYEKIFQTSLNPTVFTPIATEAIRDIGWNIVYEDPTTVEAKRKNNWGEWSEKISILYDHRKVKVRSVSLGNKIWDNGSNSIQVETFIYAFKETEKKYDKAALADLEKETEKIRNWDDYVIPDELPQPLKTKEPKAWIPLAGGIITALLSGYIIALIHDIGLYVVILNEVITGFLLAYIFKHLVTLSNYTNFRNLMFMLGGTIFMIYFSNQYFQYQDATEQLIHSNIDFLSFMKLRLNAGLRIDSIDMGWIGYIVLWAIQLGLTYIIAMYLLIFSITKYQLNRIPPEVVDFVYYHFLKGKTEEQVRIELSNMGWKEEQDQNEVFESVGALMGAIEINRME